MLASGEAGRRRTAQGRAYKAFLDVKQQAIPVAGELEFVGRRRETQRILREFKRNDAQRPTGVLIHGLGRQGKSSLAARVASRLTPQGYRTVVIFGDYRPGTILQSFASGAPAGTIDQISQIVERHLPGVESPDRAEAELTIALGELLNGPCREKTTDADSTQPKTQPVLLIIDDFEQILEPSGDRHQLTSPEHVSTMRAVLKAFRQADTQSRLLVTSRFQFTLPDAHGSLDLAETLTSLPLPPMNERESRKQAASKELVVIREEHADAQPALERIEAIRAQAKGSPGLQDRLFRLAMEDGAACDRCLEALQRWFEQQTAPSEQAVADFLENLSLQALIDLLPPHQRELLRALTLFEIPIPSASIVQLAKAIGANPDGHPQPEARLIALGLCDRYVVEGNDQAGGVAVHPLVRPHLQRLTDTEQVSLSKEIIQPLFSGWGAGDGSQRSYFQDVELTRLGLLASDAELLQHVADAALFHLGEQFQYKRAAAWAPQIVALLDAAPNLQPSLTLLRKAAEACQRVGDVANARGFRLVALGRLESGVEAGSQLDPNDHGGLLLEQANALIHEGQPDEALSLLKEAEKIFPNEREQAIVKGSIARILTNKGQIGKAAKLQNDRLSINEGLGDRDGIAAARWDLAQLQLEHKPSPETFEHLIESYKINQELGRLDGICVVGMTLGQILCANGSREQGLEILKRSLAGFQQLGWPQYPERVAAIIAQIEQSPPPEGQAPQ